MAGVAVVSQVVDRYEPEIVRGEIVERPMPDSDHAELMAQVVYVFQPPVAAGALWIGGDLRVRTSAGNIRLVDVSVYRSRPARLPENPPLVTVEILSPGDRYEDVFEKCEEYAAWGVEHIWVLEPRRRRLDVFSGGELHGQRELSLPEYGVRLAADSLFANLP